MCAIYAAQYCSEGEYNLGIIWADRRHLHTDRHNGPIFPIPICPVRPKPIIPASNTLVRHKNTTFINFERSWVYKTIVATSQ